MIYFILLFLFLGFCPTNWFWLICLVFLILPMSDVDIRYMNYRDRRRANRAKTRYSNHNDR